MKYNNPTPAMKEPQRIIEQAQKHAEQVTNCYGSGSNITYHIYKDRAEKSYLLGYEAGAQWREENPVKGEVADQTREWFNNTKEAEQFLIAHDWKEGEDIPFYKVAILLNRFRGLHPLPPTPKQDKEWIRVEDVIQVISNFFSVTEVDNTDFGALTTQIRNIK